MNDITYTKIIDRDINLYLTARNLKINRQFSNYKKKIDKLDHFVWWFSNKNRISYLVKKKNKILLILTQDKKNISGKPIINSGFISYQKKTNVFDLLKAIKWQNDNIKKYKNYYNIILVDKNNRFGILHNKYFNFKELTNKDNFYKIIKDEYKFKKNIKLFYKKIKN